MYYVLLVVDGFFYREYLVYHNDRLVDIVYISK